MESMDCAGGFFSRLKLADGAVVKCLTRLERQVEIRSTRINILRWNGNKFIEICTKFKSLIASYEAKSSYPLCRGLCCA